MPVDNRFAANEIRRPSAWKFLCKSCKSTLDFVFFNWTNVTSAAESKVKPTIEVLISSFGESDEDFSDCFEGSQQQPDYYSPISVKMEGWMILLGGRNWRVFCFPLYFIVCQTSKPVVIFARTIHQTANCFGKHRYYLLSKTDPNAPKRPRSDYNLYAFTL